MEVIQIIENFDTELVAEVKRQLAMSQGYCPSCLSRTANTKCMCKEFREQEIGECRCGLYRKVKISE